MLYLHEIIDIVGTGQEAYLDTVGERARHSEGEQISRLFGTWKVLGSTHRWPRVERSAKRIALRPKSAARERCWSRRDRARLGIGRGTGSSPCHCWASCRRR